MKTHKYRYEYEMCDEFVELNKADWDIYPECYGYDMLMFSKDSEIQIGVQAKLKNNLQVIYQILNNVDISNRIKRIGPHYGAVLTPIDDNNYYHLCRRLNIIKFNIVPIKATMNYINNVNLDGYTILNFLERHNRPIIRLNDSPGKSSPKNLSQWRIQALKIMNKYYDQGYIISSQLRELGLNTTLFTNWFEYRYREPKVGRCFKMVLKDENKHPAKGYEKELIALKNAVYS
jgi:hypothetical protein